MAALTLALPAVNSAGPPPRADPRPRIAAGPAARAYPVGHTSRPYAALNKKVRGAASKLLLR